VNDPIPLTCLGSAAAVTDGRPWNALLIDGRIALDFPPTAVPQLHRLGFDITAVDTIFISHLHADHTFGLPFLLLEYCLRCERAAPLYIVGPPGVEKMTHDLFEIAWPAMRANGVCPRAPVEFVEVDEGAHRAGDIEFEAIRMLHFDLAAFGYRIKYKNRLIAYSGDTGECSSLELLMKDADVLILEMTHPNETVDPGHMDAKAVDRLTRSARKRGVKVFATHMTCCADPIKGITLCEDGKTYDI
jgi:ribonuclease BN (tRNA processing enzyme)